LPAILDGQHSTNIQYAIENIQSLHPLDNPTIRFHISVQRELLGQFFLFDPVMALL